MKKYGYYVRLGGDAEVSATLARGDVATLLPAPMDRNEACRRVAMWQHTPEEWREMTLDAQRRYRRNRRPQGVGKALLIGYALVCLGVHTAFDWLWETIEGRTPR